MVPTKFCFGVWNVAFPVFTDFIFREFQIHRLGNIYNIYFDSIPVCIPILLQSLIIYFRLHFCSDWIDLPVEYQRDCRSSNWCPISLIFAKTQLCKTQESMDLSSLLNNSSTCGTCKFCAHVTRYKIYGRCTEWPKMTLKTTGSVLRHICFTSIPWVSNCNPFRTQRPQYDIEHYQVQGTTCTFP